jgi:hypothetical protein
MGALGASVSVSSTITCIGLCRHRHWEGSSRVSVAVGGSTEEEEGEEVEI